MDDDLTPKDDKLRLILKDDNLRLILSEGHEKWLDDKITETRRAIALLVALIVVGVAGMFGAAKLSIDWATPSLLTMMIIMVPVVLIFAATAELVRRIRELKKYRLFVEDHEGFLKKYNRL